MMNATSRPSRKTPLNATVNAYQSCARRLTDRRAAARPRPGRSRLRRGAPSGRSRAGSPCATTAARRSSRTPPTTTRSASIGMFASAGPSAPTITAKRAERGGDTPRGRSPAPRHADREHDRERLDHLDRRREEGGGDEQRTVHGIRPMTSVPAVVAYTTTMAESVAKATDSFADAGRGRAVPTSPRPSGGSPTGLLEFGAEASVLSAAVLADRLGTSDATIVRTAKALGYARSRRAAPGARRAPAAIRRSASACAAASSRHRREELFATDDRQPSRVRSRR